MSFEPTPQRERKCAQVTNAGSAQILELQRLVDPEEPAPDTYPATSASLLAQLEAENKALNHENTRMRQMLRSAVDYAIIAMDAEGCITGWNNGAERITGYTEADVLGRSGDIVFTAEDREQGKFTLELRRALESGRASNERWHVRRNGTRFWASGLMMPLLDAEDQPNGFLNILRDRTEQQAEVERRELLMAEMNHRVKNTFAMVQAVASQSSRRATSLADFETAFGSRLKALAHSHDMLIKGGWEDAPLHGLIEGGIAAYCGDGERVTVEGPAVLLKASLVVASTLAFHELATNAVKHGALSTADGMVHVSWVIKPLRNGCRQVELHWRERGGPPVTPPERLGFGSQLLARGLGQPSSSVELSFQPQGLECRICFSIGAEA